MKQLPKKEESDVAGGLVSTQIVQKPLPEPLPRPYPIEPCIPTFPNPLDTEK